MSSVCLVHPMGEDDDAEQGQCKSCSQKWTDQEQQLKPGAESKLVKWHKFHSSAAADKVPSQHECYKCFDSRRNHFPGMSQVECDKARRQSEDLNQKFSELRSNRVNGIKVKEVVNTKLYVVEEEEVFSEDAEEGTFLTIFDFTAKYAAGVCFLNMAERRQWTVDNGFDIILGKRGKEGVEVYDHGQDSYRFRRGKKDIRGSNAACALVGPPFPDDAAAEV